MKIPVIGQTFAVFAASLFLLPIVSTIMADSSPKQQAGNIVHIPSTTAEPYEVRLNSSSFSTPTPGLRGLSSASASTTKQQHSWKHICWEARRHGELLPYRGQWSLLKGSSWRVTLGACRSSDLSMTDDSTLKMQVGIPSCVYTKFDPDRSTRFFSGRIEIMSNDKGQQIEQLRANLRSRKNPQTAPAKEGYSQFVTNEMVCVQSKIWSCTREELPHWESLTDIRLLYGRPSTSGIDAISRILTKLGEEHYGKSNFFAKLIGSRGYAAILDEKLKLIVFPTICPYALVDGPNLENSYFSSVSSMRYYDPRIGCPDNRPNV